MSWLTQRGKKGTYYYCTASGLHKSLKTNIPSIAKGLQNKLDRGEQFSQSGLIDLEKTWADYRRDYQEDFTVLAENTIVKLEYVLNKFESMVHPTTLRGVSPEQCVKWRNTRLKEVCPVTVETETKYLRPFFAKAHSMGYIERNPMAVLKPLKFPRPRSIRPAFADEERFLENLEPEYRHIGVLLADTGMRREDLAAQRMRDVNFSAGAIFVRNHEATCDCLLCTRKRKMDRRTKRPGLCNTKNLAERMIPMTARVRAILEEIRKTFATDCLYRMHELTITQICKRAWAKAGVAGKVAAHTLRHCFADDLRRAGVDEEVRKALMGHTGGIDAHQTYMHVSDEELFAAIKRLEEWREAQRVKFQKTTVDGFQVLEAAG